MACKDVGVEEDLALGDPEAAVGLDAQDVGASTGVDVGLRLQPVPVDQERAADAQLAVRRWCRTMTLEIRWRVREGGSSAQAMPES